MSFHFGCHGVCQRSRGCLLVTQRRAAGSPGAVPPAAATTSVTATTTTVTATTSIVQRMAAATLTAVELCCRLLDEYGDVATYKGRVYLEKLQVRTADD